MCLKVSLQTMAAGMMGMTRGVCRGDLLRQLLRVHVPELIQA